MLVTPKIKNHLKLLKIKVHSKKVPSFTSVRKVYKTLVRSHPDKGGDTSWFQEMTLAVRELLQFITEHPELVEEPEEAEDETTEEDDDIKDLLRVFSNSSELKYNKDSVTFNVEKGRTSEWMRKFEEYFSSESCENSKSDKGLFFFKDSAWVLPGKEGQQVTGSLTVSYWPYPTTTIPRVCVQGTQYLAFLTIDLPKMAKSVQEVCGQIEQVKEPVKEQDNKAEHTQEKNPAKEPVTEKTPAKEAVKEKTAVKEREPIKKSDSPEVQGEVAAETTNQVIERLQIALVEKMSMMEAKLTISLEKQAEIKTTVDTLITDVKVLKQNTESSKKEIISKIEEVKVFNKSEWDKKVNDILAAAKGIQKNIDSMKSIINKQKPTNKEGKEDTPENVEVIEIQKKKREGILFHSSVTKGIDIERLEKTTDSKITLVKTSRIFEDGTSTNPLLYLQKTVKDNMTDKFDFAMFAVGSNDVEDTGKDKDLTNSQKLDKVKDQAELLVTAATEVTNEFRCEAFIVEQIPRHDSPEAQKLQKFANSHLGIQVMAAATARVHLVSQSSLFRHPGLARDSMYRNANHLNTKGLYQYSTNLISEIQEVFHMKDIDIHPSEHTLKKTDPGKDKKKEVPKYPPQSKPKYPPQPKQSYNAQSYPQQFQAPVQQTSTNTGSWGQGVQQNYLGHQVQQQHQGPEHQQSRHQGPQQYHQGLQQFQQSHQVYQQGPQQYQQGHSSRDQQGNSSRDQQGRQGFNQYQQGLPGYWTPPPTSPSQHLPAPSLQGQWGPSQNYSNSGGF